MMNIQIKEQFLKEYDKLTKNVNESRKDNFPVNLVKWFDYLEDSDIVPVKFFIAVFMGNPNFDDFYSRFSVYIFLNDSDPFIKQIKEACRVLDQVQRRSGIWNDFQLLNYTYSDIQKGVFNVDNFSLTDYLLKFKNFSDGLREVFEKSLGIAASDPTVDNDEQREIPASDRIVKINDNAPEFKIIIEKIEALETAISKSNSIGNEDKDRLQAELKAGEGILKGKTARIEVIKTLLVNGLKYIIKHVTDAAITVTAEYLLKLICQYFGLTG